MSASERLDYQGPDFIVKLFGLNDVPTNRVTLNADRADHADSTDKINCIDPNNPLNLLNPRSEQPNISASFASWRLCGKIFSSVSPIQTDRDPDRPISKLA